MSLYSLPNTRVYDVVRLSNPGRMGSVTAVELYIGNVLDVGVNENDLGNAVVENNRLIPLNRNLVLYPLKGESLIFLRDESIGKQYYIPFPISSMKNTHHNVTDDIENINQFNFIEREDINSLNARPGDLIVEGRYNNSIRLSHNEGKGEILIRCDVQSTNNEESYIDEDVNINSSFASLSVSSVIPIELANDNFKSIK